MPDTSATFWPAYGEMRVVPWMSWMRTESACAGEVRATADAAEQTAATVSAARRAEDLLGNGIPPGTCVGAGTRVVLGTVQGRDRWGGGDARRKYSEHVSASFLRASISCVRTPVVKVSAMYGRGPGDEP